MLWLAHSLWDEKFILKPTRKKYVPTIDIVFCAYLLIVINRKKSRIFRFLIKEFYFQKIQKLPKSKKHTELIIAMFTYPRLIKKTQIIHKRLARGIFWNHQNEKRKLMKYFIIEKIPKAGLWMFIKNRDENTISQMI